MAQQDEEGKDEYCEEREVEEEEEFLIKFKQRDDHKPATDCGIVC